MDDRFCICRFPADRGTGSVKQPILYRLFGFLSTVFCGCPAKYFARFWRMPGKTQGNFEKMLDKPPNSCIIVNALLSADGQLAQLEEHLLDVQGVRGSSPLLSTIQKTALAIASAVFCNEAAPCRERNEAASQMKKCFRGAKKPQWRLRFIGRLCRRLHSFILRSPKSKSAPRRFPEK